MNMNQIKTCNAVARILDLSISIIIVKVVNTICNDQVPIKLIICLCFLSIFKWIIKKYSIDYFTLEIKQQRNILLSNYLNSNRNDDISTHLKKILENDLELFITYETRYKIEIFCCFIAICIYSLQISIDSIILCFLILVIGFLQGIIPVLYEGKFSKNYQQTCLIEEDIEDFYYEIISHFEKCFFLPVSYLSNILKEKNRAYMQIGIKSEATAQKYNGLMNALNVFAQIGVCFICLLLANIGMFQLTKTLGITYLSIQTLSVFYEIFQFFQIRPAAKAAQKRIEEIMNLNSSIPSKAPRETKSLFVIKGKNGAGKSTLLKKQFLSETEAFFYVPQSELVLNITPSELFSIYPESRQAYIKSLFRWDDALNNHLLSTLSSGERKKVELMCAFMSNRKIYMDEPENALDSENRELLLNAIENYKYKIVIATNSSLYDVLQREEYHINYA